VVVRQVDKQIDDVRTDSRPGVALCHQLRQDCLAAHKSLDGDFVVLACHQLAREWQWDLALRVEYTACCRDELSLVQRSWNRLEQRRHFC
jgi:hypothetical protein